MEQPAATPAGPPGAAAAPAAPALREPSAAPRALPPAEAPALRRVPRGPRGMVTILLPAKNEEQGIGATLRAIPMGSLAAAGFGAEVVVLDGASEDRTCAIARAWGATVVGQRRPGKGAAFRDALPLLDGDYVVMLDADATYPPDTVPLVLEPLARGDADVVMGSRRKGRAEPGAMGPLNRAGNLALSALASLLFLRRCSDVCTGLWGFRAEALRALPLESEGFELEVELFGRAARAGLRIREVPVDYLPRRGGTKLSRVRDGVRIGWWLLRTRFAPARRAAAASPLRHAGRGRRA